MDEFGYFDHDADIGIRGRGRTVERAFESAAEAVFAIMAETVPEPLDEVVTFSFEEEDAEFALVTEKAGLARRVAFLRPKVCIKG
ncbi:MAG: archease [Thiovulaceae bacterium]|nr:archease [Sulfurimonadaceae bacterium]